MNFNLSESNTTDLNAMLQPYGCTIADMQNWTELQAALTVLAADPAVKGNAVQNMLVNRILGRCSKYQSISSRMMSFHLHRASILGSKFIHVGCPLP